MWLLLCMYETNTFNLQVIHFSSEAIYQFFLEDANT